MQTQLTAEEIIWGQFYNQIHLLAESLRARKATLEPPTDSPPTPPRRHRSTTKGRSRSRKRTVQNGD